MFVKFRRHLKIDDNWTCLLTLRSINPFGIGAPLSLVFKDLGAIEVT